MFARLNRRRSARAVAAAAQAELPVGSCAPDVAAGRMTRGASPLTAPFDRTATAPLIPSRLLCGAAVVAHEAPLGVGRELPYAEWREQGRDHRAAGRIREAVQALARAAALRPERPEAHLELGLALQEAGKIEAARDAYQRALRSDPDCSDAVTALQALQPPPPPRVDFAVGQHLLCTATENRYTVLRALGGKFGAVYIVSDEEDRHYALKTFQARYLWRDAHRDRFEREAVIWVMLDRHPNLVTALWVDRIEGFPCLVLEYVSGGDLKQRLSRGRLPWDQVLGLVLQFCDGMGHAYGKLQMIHRDIKPSNCMLTADGRLKITDLGLARAFGEAWGEDLGLGEFGSQMVADYTSALGTQNYMAPEQLAADSRLDTRTDLHAFGVMLYQLWTGDLPDWGPVAEAYIRQRPETCAIPDSLKQLILRCVARCPHERPGGFAEVRRELEVIYRAVTSRPTPPPAPPDPMGAADWQNKGVALYALGWPEPAVACFDQALRQAPANSDLLKGKGAALYRLGRYAEAQGAFKQGLQAAPRDADLWNNLGLARKATGHLSGALSCYDRGLAIVPNDTSLLRNKGNALGSQGKVKKALAYYDRALAVDSRDAGLWEQKGLALLQLAQFETAQSCFEAGLRIAQREAGLWKGRGLALHGRRSYREAISCYDRAFEIAPGDADLWKAKGASLLYRQAPAEALDCYTKGLEITRDDPELWKGRGAALHLLNRMPEAIVCFHEAMARANDDSELCKNTGAAYYDLRSPQEALIWWRRGLRINPQDRFLWKNHGLALHALGRSEKAIISFNCGLVIDSSDRDLWASKALVLEALRRDPDPCLGLRPRLPPSSAFLASCHLAKARIDSIVWHLARATVRLPKRVNRRAILSKT